MSSHREAPGISKDPVADNTDLYAFVSPDKPDTVTIIANFIPLEDPPGGPNFYEFGEHVLYRIFIDNDGDGKPEIAYAFRFHTDVRDPDTFLYNTGQITSLDSKTWNRRQFYDVTKNVKGKITKVGNNLPCPPCNIGPRSTPNYESALGSQAIRTLSTGEKVFAGQRAEEFYVDLGSIFDLGALRPFQNLHLIPLPANPGVNGTAGFNVHTIALQIPKKELTRDHSDPTDISSERSVIGVWASASRRKTELREHDGVIVETGPQVQVSRLGNPLINEVIIPMGKKDYWNSQKPASDSEFAKYYAHPELAKLLPVLYPGVFPHLANLSAARKDLEAILLTGIPSGIIPNFQNFTGPTQADTLRLNMAIPPASHPNILGILGGDLAGFPNGRRLVDDVVTIELRAVAGATYPLIDPSFQPDAAATKIDQGLTPSSVPRPVKDHFPYMGVPLDGFHTKPAA
jgi:hypothetical protein